MAAISKNRVIGKEGHLPWSLPADLDYFKKTTMGHPVIMGRKTFESLREPLPGRQNIIITKKQNYHPPDCLIMHSIDEARSFCKEQNGFVIGGSQIYRQFFPYVERLYITFINEVFAGDCFFPEIEPKIWRLISETQGEQNELNPYEYYFLVYAREL